MPSAMRARRFRERLIGLLAAYLVALQALVLPLSMPATFAGTLCITEPSGDPAQQPVDHDHGCPCCAGCGMLCHVPALAGAGTVTVPAPQLRLAALLEPAPFEAAPRIAARIAQMPRGPPSA